MCELRAFIANCTVAGLDKTGDEKSWVRDTIHFEVNGRIFTLKQHKYIANNNYTAFEGQFCETSVLTVKDVKDNKVSGIKLDIHKLCWLLSLACLSQVVFYGYDYPANQMTGPRWAVNGKLAFFRPTIEIRDAAIVKSFIEQTFNNYKLLESSRKLNVAIHYMLLIENNNLPTEAKLALSFVLLENLKSSYAHSKNIPYIDGFFRKGDNPNKKSDTYSFLVLLKMMFNEVGVTRDLSQIKDIRNEIIHSGLTQLTQDKAIELHDDIHDLCREYLLKVLGYRGDYLLYSSGSNTVRTI